MAVAVTISDAAKAYADALVASGRYGSFDEVVEAGLRRRDEEWIDEPVDLDELSP